MNMTDGIAVAIAYLMQKQPYVFPILGGNTINQLKGNIQALQLKLSDAQIKEIEDAVPFELGFPFKHIVSQILIIYLEVRRDVPTGYS